MRPLIVILFEVCFKIILHFIDGLIPFGPALNAEVFIEKGPMESFHKAFAPRPSNLDGTVFDLFELEEQFIGVTIRPATVLAAIIA